MNKTDHFNFEKFAKKQTYNLVKKNVSAQISVRHITTG